MTKYQTILNNMAMDIEKASKQSLIRSPDKACMAGADCAMVCLYDIDICSHDYKSGLCVTLTYGPYGENIRINIHYTPIIKEPIITKLNKLFHYTHKPIKIELYCCDAHIIINRHTSPLEIMCKITNAMRSMFDKNEICMLLSSYTERR